ncbi:GNAT domain-containing protein [Podospora appendiculata]|uniref:GNAT domain-containing protein n=1 Tax=Podospora appendiculata TaxID=314037 RepID=A0AAE0XKS2_9PEZI|nr:GNAT domain-containing protein [Podospora appendiculata]
MAEPDPKTFVTVKTTLPRKPYTTINVRPSITTERLILRALTPDDVQPLHIIRTQPEVMIWTSRGTVDKDLAATQNELAFFLPPKDETTFNFAICLRETGEMVGIGGHHNKMSSFGWPEVGYMFRKEAWGKGYGTEFLKAFVREYAALPREEVVLKIDPRTVTAPSGEGGRAGDGAGELLPVVEEQLVALTEINNSRSWGVMKKAGFEHFLTWVARDTRYEEHKPIELPAYRYFVGRPAAQ